MNPQTSYQDLEKFYNGGKAKKSSKKKVTSTSKREQKDGPIKGSFTQFTKQRREDIDQSKTKSAANDGYCKNMREEARSLSVAQKLKELEMMDISNVDHVLDIEEVRHYYSRLTCPAYLDIVDKFFMEMYIEFLGPPASPKGDDSRPKFRSART